MAAAGDLLSTSFSLCVLVCVCVCVCAHARPVFVIVDEHVADARVPGARHMARFPPRSQPHPFVGQVVVRERTGRDRGARRQAQTTRA